MRDKKIFLTFFFTVSLIILFLNKIAFSQSSQGKLIPDHIRQLVFEKSNFSKPITLRLPCEDDPKLPDQIAQAWMNRSILEPIISTCASQFYQGFYQNSDVDKILQLLVKNNFLIVRKINLMVGTREVKYKMYSYLHNITNHIIEGTFEFKNCKCINFTHDSGGFLILLANRTLKSIDYTNQYEAAPLGVKVKIYALTFTYTLTDKLPGLPKVTTQFKGKAKAYLDPDDGEWKLDDLSLPDEGIAEYIRLITIDSE